MQTKFTISINRLHESIEGQMEGKYYSKSSTGNDADFTPMTIIYHRSRHGINTSYHVIPNSFFNSFKYRQSVCWSMNC